MCTDIEKFIETAHLINGDLLTGFFLSVFSVNVFTQRFGLQKAKIRVIPLSEPIARQTFPTGCSIGLR